MFHPDMILYGLIIPHTEEMIADFSPIDPMNRLGKNIPRRSSHRALMAAIFSLSFLFFSSFASQSITQFRKKKKLPRRLNRSSWYGVAQSERVETYSISLRI